MKPVVHSNVNLVVISAIALGVLCVCTRPASAVSPDDMKVAGRTLEGWVKDLDSANEIVRLRAVKSLGPFGKSALPALAKSLADTSDGVKYWAADHVGAIGPDALDSDLAEKIVSRLEAMVKQDEKAISIAATFALFQLKKKKARLQTLTDKLVHPERGMACSSAEFLGKIGPAAKAALPALEKQFKQHKDYHVRGACQNAIRKIKNEPVK